MSKYKVIRTEFRSLQTLQTVFKEIGIIVVINKVPTDNNLPLFGYKGDVRKERAAIVIKRQQVNRFSGGCSNDIGFLYNQETGSYELVLSEFDQKASAKLISDIRQRYAIKEITRVATRQGYRVQAGKLGQTVQVGKIST